MVMDGPVVVFMLLSALSLPPSSPSPHRYFLVEEAKPWPEARQHCRGRQADLAGVKDAAQMDQVVDVSRRYFRGHVWIGLHYKPSGWTWSLRDEGRPAQDQFRAWGSGEPNDPTRAKENCVFVKDGAWFDAPCRQRLPFVCSNGSVDRLSLVPVDLEVNWNQAQRFCRENHTDLASVGNEADNDRLKELTAGAARWIGLHRTPWKWSDGTPVSFSKWNTAAGEPSQGVGTPCVLAHRGHWEDEDCGRRLFFVCRTVPTVTRVKIRVTAQDPSGSLEASAGAVLQQLAQRAKDAGLKPATLLSWTKQLDGNVFQRGQEELEDTEDESCSVSGA